MAMAMASVRACVLQLQCVRPTSTPRRALARVQNQKSLQLELSWQIVRRPRVKPPGFLFTLPQQRETIRGVARLSSLRLRRCVVPRGIRLCVGHTMHVGEASCIAQRHKLLSGDFPTWP